MQMLGIGREEVMVIFIRIRRALLKILCLLQLVDLLAELLVLLLKVTDDVGETIPFQLCPAALLLQELC